MDLRKAGWMARERLRKVWYRVLLRHYKKKYERSADESTQVYYFWQMQMMSGLVHSELEEEYLAEHGPQEEPEQEAEPEPGLLKEMGFSELILQTISLGESFYLPESVKIYADRIVIRIKKSESCEDEQGMLEMRELGEKEVSISCGETRYAAFEMDGLTWRWDREDSVLRVIPQPKTDETTQISEAIHVIDKQILRVERGYAEKNLSPVCLDYAFGMEGEWYSWSMADHSHRTVLHELRDVFSSQEDGQSEWENERLLRVYCPTYVEKTEN